MNSYSVGGHHDAVALRLLLAARAREAEVGRGDERHERRGDGAGGEMGRNGGGAPMAEARDDRAAPRTGCIPPQAIVNKLSCVYLVSK